MTDYRLAQLNIGRLKAPVDAPETAGFTDNLDRINALAEASPGFVWRLQDEAGAATSIRPFDDEDILVNLSVWTDVEALKAFVYRSAHVEIFRKRADWFHKMEGVHMVLWWVPAGHMPGVEEAKARLIALQEKGPHAEAFTFRDYFDPPA